MEIKQATTLTASYEFYATNKATVYVQADSGSVWITVKEAKQFREELALAINEAEVAAVQKKADRKANKKKNKA